MKIVLFARTLGSTQLCKISQESSLLSNFGNLPKIRNAQFGRSRPLGVKQGLNRIMVDLKPNLKMVPFSSYNFLCALKVLFSKFTSNLK